MSEVDLALITYRQEGDLAHEYNPLRNRLSEENQIIEFDTDELEIDLNHPVNIECQPSYDGTVNLILNDDKNPPRIINTRFSKLENDRYKIINRNQREQTNLYKDGKIDQQTRLFRNVKSIPYFDLLHVSNIGQLKGGNYTFYLKLADNDFNKTDIVAESGVVSIFKGYENKVKTVSGTIFEERTDKAITLRISNLDISFSKFYIYYIRETCDQNGIRITKAGMLSEPYEIKGPITTITINGFEDEETLTPEEINIQYNIVTAAKTQAQVQNMLFFGNVQSTILNVKDLQNLSYYIKVGLRQKTESIGWINTEDYSQKETDDIDQTEYYSTHNIYYNLGYWPDEIYRLGVVYILADDSLTPVFNLRGHIFSNATDDYNFTNLNLRDEEGNINYLPRNEFLTNASFLDNTLGVFKNPSIEIIKYSNSEVKPLYYQISIDSEVIEELKKLKVKGLFIVRQKRIPTSLCQGFSVGVDRISYTPMLWYNTRPDNKPAAYVAESFLTEKYTLSTSIDSHLIYTDKKQCSGLLCVDAMVNPQLQANFDGSEFILRPQTTSAGQLNKNKRHWYENQNGNFNNAQIQTQTPITYIDSEIPMKFMNGAAFSTKCGAAEDVSKFSFFSETNKSEKTNKLLRGVYCPFLGTNYSLQDNTIYTIKVPNYSGALMKDYFNIRGKDNAPFYAISNRYELDSFTSIDCFRGDCYTNTVTVRLNRNFVDSDVPINDTIINIDTWKKNYKGYSNMVNGAEAELKDTQGDFVNINRADVNTVPLGMWVTYKCLSNYNLGLRSIDISHSDEYALMGSPRSFYPVTDMSTTSSQKVNESCLLNDGYCSTLGQKRNFIVDNVPYIKELFDNRIMFSNVQREDNFQNAYRVFQGLSFKDIDRQYGAIVKFVPYNNNIFCVFEHGLGIIPINEKALIQTSTNQSIHMYGAGVLQNQITLISPDFGSIWQESIIRTPIGIYGVDTYAKKIWRFSDKGLEIISDTKVQRFLNDNIKLAEKHKYPIIALRNIKSHYNNFKGDLMFTFYNEGNADTWNICYNERMGKWITRYSWTPLYSENINNIFYSLDQNRSKILSYIYNNKNCTYGLRTTNNQWTIETSISPTSDFTTSLSTIGYDLADSFTYKIKSIETSYLDENNVEIPVKITDGTEINRLFSINNTTSQISGFYSEVYTLFNNIYHTIVPAYFKLNIQITINIGSSSTTYNDIFGIVVDNKLLENSNNTTLKALYTKQQNYFLRNGFYVHGKAGIFNEIEYRDDTFENEILPTKWYDRQEPFEFEFVVNDEIGLHKIFDNLVIISNNVQPNQIEYEIIGDVYKFNKAGIFRSKEFGELDNQGNNREWDIKYNKPKFIQANEKRVYTQYPNSTKFQTSQEFDNCKIIWDDVLNQYSILTTQDCKNIEKYGRRLGNIQYKEDSWYITIDPIKYKEKYRINDGNIDDWTGVKEKYSKMKEVRIRDKFVKIRVKYTGEDMVIITALRTILTPSYS